MLQNQTGEQKDEQMPRNVKTLTIHIQTILHTQIIHSQTILPGENVN